MFKYSNDTFLMSNEEYEDLKQYLYTVYDLNIDKGYKLSSCLIIE